VGRRAGLSTVLIVGAFVLLIAIAVGQNMGNRVLGQIASRAVLQPPTPIPAASPSPGAESGNQALWKRREVISVATDPAFPDPRVTPEPPPPETPRPAPPRPAHTRTPEPEPTDDTQPRNDAASPYTSPPMPIPLITHEPSTTATDAAATPTGSPEPSPAPRFQFATPRPGAAARPTPTIPPYSTPIP
jgi:hypothetical protein